MILLVVILALYLVPTYVAMMRSSANVSGVFIVNLLTGWSVIGWIAALVMACTGQRRPAVISPQAGTGQSSSVYARPGPGAQPAAGAPEIVPDVRGWRP
jgi:hypothetical protein